MNKDDILGHDQGGDRDRMMRIMKNDDVMRNTEGDMMRGDEVKDDVLMGDQVPEMILVVEGAVVRQCEYTRGLYKELNFKGYNMTFRNKS